MKGKRGGRLDKNAVGVKFEKRENSEKYSKNLDSDHRYHFSQIQIHESSQ